jgi:predicted nucleotide-binding protein
MVRRPSAPPKAPQSARMSADEMQKGIIRLQRRLKMIEEFDPSTLDPRDPNSTVRPISTEIESALIETFGHDTTEYKRFRLASSLDWPIVMGGGIPHHQKVEAVTKDRQRSIQLLTAAISLLEERSESVRSAQVEPPAAQKELSNRIFIVHGHDNEPKEAAARYLTALGFKPIILHEQVSKGRTIIEKFRDEAADVGFAVVLMTEDDEAASGRKRARQNVVLELGFFLGALGSSNVAVIVKGDVEKPSDYDGVVYIPFDANWQIRLAKEIEAAGFSIDWNVVMRS